MSQDFKPIFDYLDEMKADLKTDIFRLESKVDAISTAVDILTKMVKGFEEEMIVNRHRIERLEEWAKLVSQKTGIPMPF